MTSLSGMCVLFLFIILSCNADVSTFHNGNGSSPSHPQSPKSATELIAALDGTVSLVDSASGKVIWSFSTGPPIHYSFQAPMNDSNKAASGLIEVGDDWELFIHDDTDLGKTKLSQSLVEYVVSTPIMSKNKAIIDGSRFGTVFCVDAKTGRLVWSDDKDRKNELTVPTQLSSPEFLLTIARFDYVLKSVDYVSVKVLWTLEVAEFKVALSCQRSGNTTSKGEYAPDSKSGLDFAMPYACGDRKYRQVYRQRNTCRLIEDLPRKTSVKQLEHFLQHQLPH